MASPISVRSNDSGYSSADSCLSCELPKSSYDGSHLPWKVFRQQVLGPHRIRVLDTVPKDRLSDSLLSLIEQGTNNASRFEGQKTKFRDQVNTGRAFGPSPLFPPNLLPPTDKEGNLARCMIPTFSREALPERLNNQVGPLYELSVPRCGLGCGFSMSALEMDEIDVIPSYLCPTGTMVNFETGYISPGAAIYCPYLVFERAFGVKEHRLETANNQCAIGGAWCVRALQMLYARAYKGETLPTPVSFSCSVDNTFAIINIHWIEMNQTYCMAPLCKFDLSKDDHFTKFLVWIDAIDEWALTTMLPVIRAALQRLRVKEPTPPATPEEEKQLTLSLNTGRCPDEVLMHSLKTTFDNIPWRYQEDDCTPVSSSTASWGSPMTDIAFTYPDNDTKSQASDRTVVAKRKHLLIIPTSQATPAPTYAVPPELIMQKRLNHALDEIKDLQQQLHVLKTNFHNSTNSTHNELSAVKITLASVLRKESLMVRSRSVSFGPGSGLGLHLTSKDDSWSSLASIPASPPPHQVSFDTLSSIPSLGAHTGGGNLRSTLLSATSEKPAIPSPLVLQDPSTRRPPPTPLLPNTESPPVTASTTIPPTPYTAIPPTPYTPYLTVPPPPPTAGSSSASLVKWTGITLSAHLLGSLIPMMSVRVVVLGMVTEMALLSVASPHYATSWEWMVRMVERPQ